jgi:hypothetical protein
LNYREKDRWSLTPGEDYFAETFIHERVLTIEADGYETLRFPLMPELGAANTYELRRK